MCASVYIRVCTCMYMREGGRERESEWISCGSVHECTVWLQIFIVQNFRNFRNCMVTTKIIFTKIFVLSIGHFHYWVLPITRCAR